MLHTHYTCPMHLKYQYNHTHVCKYMVIQLLALDIMTKIACILYHLRFMIQHAWKGICKHSKRKRISTLDSSNFCISIPFWKLGMTIFYNTLFPIGGHNLWFDPMPNIFTGSGNAHNEATYINGTPIFKLYMARLVVENRPKKSVTMRLDFLLFLLPL